MTLADLNLRRAKVIAAHAQRALERAQKAGDATSDQELDDLTVARDLADVDVEIAELEVAPKRKRK